MAMGDMSFISWIPKSEAIIPFTKNNGDVAIQVKAYSVWQRQRFSYFFSSGALVPLTWRKMLHTILNRESK